MTSSAGSPACRCGKRFPIPSLTPRTTWCWWTSPDDLRQRLNEGKVYIGGRAERAIENFFRKGNLIALRELALRRTADRVDEQMRLARPPGRGESLAHPRCDPSLYRAQHRQRKAGARRRPARRPPGSVWHAVYVETPSLHRLPEGRRRAILAALRLAQSWGPKPPPSPTRRKRKRSSITPANITSAKSSLAAKASAAGGIAAASPIVWLAMRRTSIWW